MRQVEAFSGVQVLTYCFMTNPVHLLLRGPERKVLSELGTRNSERGTGSGQSELGTRGSEWEDGSHREVQAGFAPEAVEKVFEEKGMLKSWVIAGHRRRWLTDGAVIGSKAYVQEFRTAMREKLGLKRPVGAYEAQEDAGVCMLRALRGE